MDTLSAIFLSPLGRLENPYRSAPRPTVVRPRITSGSCGETNVKTDYIVALNSDQYGSGYPGAYCGKSITISAEGTTAVATIMDKCPGCDYGSLDLSEGLFKHFASLDDGVFPITWWFNDDTASSTTGSSTKKTSTSVSAAKSSSVSVAPTTPTDRPQPPASMLSGGPNSPKN